MSVTKRGVGSTGSNHERSVHVVALFVATLRLGTLVQMVPSCLVAVSVSPSPLLCVVAWGVAVAASVATAGHCFVRRRPPGGTWMAVDVAAGVALLLVGIATVPEEHRLGSWVGFQPGYALGVAFTLVGLRSRAAWSAGVGALLLALTAYLSPLFDSHRVDLAAAVGDLLTLVVLSSLARAGAGAVLGLARTADENRALAVAATRDAEAQRGRVAVHNAAAMIRLLLDLDRRPGDPAHDVRAPLLRQASEELTRMRSYLGRGAPAVDSSVSLATLVRSVAEEFTDLDVVAQTELAREVTLPPLVREDLATALRSLLLNVRQHARADQVVVHVESTAPQGWRLTVHDDGTGFDPAAVRWGTGLSDVVVGQLSLHGIAVGIDSLPGVGTTVTVRSRLHDAAPLVRRG